jgi:hypothetical protein
LQHSTIAVDTGLILNGLLASLQNYIQNHKQKSFKMDENKRKNVDVDTTQPTREEWRKNNNLPPMGEEFVNANIGKAVEARTKNNTTFKGKEI